MATAKTATVTFRIDPGVKEAHRTVAARERRSIANMVEVLIRDYCERTIFPLGWIRLPGAMGGEMNPSTKNNKLQRAGCGG